MENPKISEAFDLEAFAKRLRYLRIDVLNMKIDDFAEKVGIGSGAVRHYEHGRCIPGSYAVFNICKTFGVSADWLLGLSGGADNGR